MGGFNSVTTLETIVFADNASFDGTERGGALSADGELWIGSSTSNRANNGGHVRKGTLTPGNAIGIVNGPGSIVISTTSFSRIVTQSFIATGTYTPTSGMKYCMIECVGGGAGGGGVAGGAGNAAAAGGGGGGAYARGVFSATDIGLSQTVTVGNAGSGGANTGTNGSIGGASSVGSLITAAGGSFGNGVNTPSAAGVALGGAGAGGGFTSGQFTAAGGAGTPGQWNASYVIGGSGGNAGLGSGGTPFRAITASTFQAGVAGAVWGGGGGGGVQNNSATGAAGGAGAQGYVFITEFI